MSDFIFDKNRIDTTWGGLKGDPNNPDAGSPNEDGENRLETPNQFYNRSDAKFFDAYLQSFSSSVQWGAEGGSLQITIVEDTDNDIYANIPPVGSFVAVTLDGFYFSGILQKWTYKESRSGRTIDVVIENAGSLLDATQVILGDFHGTFFNEGNRFVPFEGPFFLPVDFFVNSFYQAENFDHPPEIQGEYVYNVINAFGYKENYIANGPGMHRANFGDADTNEDGFPAGRLLRYLELLSQPFLSGVFGRYLYFNNSNAYLNLYELRQYFPEDSDYRVKGPVQSLQGIVQELCDAAGLDFYVELFNIKPFPESYAFEIYIRTISRASQPDVGAIRNYVEQAKADEKVISCDLGYEFSHPVTHKVALGGPASRLVVQDWTNMYPVWGKDKNNNLFFNLNQPSANLFYDDLLQEFNIPYPDFSGDVYTVRSIFELRMATAGKEAWEAYKCFEFASGLERNGLRPGSIDVFSAYAAISVGNFTALDAETTSFNEGYRSANQASLDRAFSAVSACANNFYGQAFLVKLGYYEPGGVDGNIRFIDEDVRWEHIWEISDSAWEPTKPFPDVNFYDSVGRLKGGAAWSFTQRADYSALGSDWANTPDGGIATHKGGPAEKDIYWITDPLDDDGRKYPYVFVDPAVRLKFLTALLLQILVLAFCLNYFLA